MNKKIRFWLLVTFFLTTVSLAQAQPAKSYRVGVLVVGSAAGDFP